MSTNETQKRSRSISINDRLWYRLKCQAMLENVSISSIVTRLLQAHYDVEATGRTNSFSNAQNLPAKGRRLLDTMTKSQAPDASPWQKRQIRRKLAKQHGQQIETVSQYKNLKIPSTKGNK